MLSDNNKQLAIDEKIEGIDFLKEITLSYIDKINDGMEDPDISISQCIDILSGLDSRKQALLELKLSI